MSYYDEITLESALETAQIHAQRLKEAMGELASTFPISEEKANNLNREELLLIELMTSRFAKLQDLLGKKLFNLFLENVGEELEGLTFLDKLHKLEKLFIIENAVEWREMRDLRNHLSHEYPHRPDLMAKFLNKTYELAPRLIGYLDAIILRAKDIKW